MRYSRSASSTATPNLFSRSPVEMYGCVFGSTSGFTRTDTGARFPASAAMRSMRSSSPPDSTLKQRIPAASAWRISASDLPTPENTTLPGSAPAATTRASSPPETMSNPAPRRANTSSTARLEFAFIA